MKGDGVHDIYKERAQKGGDVLWHVTIKDRKELMEGIPLHMSLKVFEDKKDMNLDEIKQKVKEFQIKTPKPEDLTFKTTIFTSERDGKKYYMLLVEGTDKSYKDFYESLKHCGTVYKKFMAHITIDKDLYDQINQEGLGPEEIKFNDLTIEAGSGNTIYEFRKSENFLEVIRETIALNPEFSKYEVATLLNEECLSKYLSDRPGLDEQILKKHEDRIKHHFGDDLEAVNHAFKNGIRETYLFLNKRK
jgi:2'-5' RNA ligase